MELVVDFCNWHPSTGLSCLRHPALSTTKFEGHREAASRKTEAIKMIRVGDKSQAEIAESFNVDRSTISRMMKEVRKRNCSRRYVDLGRHSHPDLIAV